MKRLLVLIVLLGSGSPLLAETKAALDNKVRELTARLEALQAQPKDAIPSTNLSRAVGIILMERTKGGLVFGYEKGSGIAMVKDEEGKWSPFLFMTSHEGSFGAQIGGKHTFSVVLLMNEAAKNRLLQNEVEFGGEATGTGGYSSEGTGETFSNLPPVLMYGVSSGVYGGATIKGGTITADHDANTAYYGQFYSPREILFDRVVQRSETATELVRKLTEFSQAKE